MDRLDELGPDWGNGDPSITESGKRQKSMGRFRFLVHSTVGRRCAHSRREELWKEKGKGALSLEEEMVERAFQGPSAQRRLWDSVDAWNYDKLNHTRYFNPLCFLHSSFYILTKPNLVWILLGPVGCMFLSWPNFRRTTRRNWGLRTLGNEERWHGYQLLLNITLHTFILTSNGERRSYLESYKWSKFPHFFLLQIMELSETLVCSFIISLNCRWGLDRTAHSFHLK